MISVIVPIYNSEKTLARCINSIINQTYSDIEIILINDGSNDGSLEICEFFAKKDDRIVIISQPNSGVSSARNIGIQKAKGEYIQFVDSDDFIDDVICEKMIVKIEKSNSDIVICGFKTITPWRIREISYVQTVYESIKDIEDQFDVLYNNAFFHSMCNKLYKKNLILNKLDENLSLGEDLLFNLDYFNNMNRIATIQDCHYNYVISQNLSLSKIIYDDEINIMLIRHNRLAEFCNRNGFDSSILMFLTEKLLENLIGGLLKRPLINFITLNKYKEYKILVEDFRDKTDVRKVHSLTSTLIYNRKYLLLWIMLILKKVHIEMKKKIKFVYYLLMQGE